MKKILAVSLVVALVLIGISLWAPLSKEPVRIVNLQDAPDSIELLRGAHLRQRIHLSEGTYSGVVVFSNAPTLDRRKLHVRIEDRSGAVIAQGDKSTTSYRQSADVLRIEISTPWFTVTHDDFYMIDLTIDHGDSLSLRVMSRDKDLPNVHKLSLDGVSQNAVLSLSFMQRLSTESSLRQGMVIGIVFLLAITLLSCIQDLKRKYWAAVALIVLGAPLAVLGYIYSTGDLGIADWDYYFTLHDSYRKALLQYHTFPLWDPYICGGTAGLADPEFPFFSPTFLLELIFGIPVGVRLAIVLSVIVTAIGMVQLARSLGRSVEAGLLSALAVAFGTVSLLEVTEGHVNVFAAMWIPWILWSWLEVYRGRRAPLLCGVFLALAFLGGGIYLLMYTTLAFIGLVCAVRQHRRAFFLTCRSALWALGLASFKLIPVLYWLDQFPDPSYEPSTYTLPWLSDIFFGRYLHGSYVILHQASGWHEYGAYIGYGVVALALVGTSLFWKNRIVRSLTVAAVIAIFLSSLGPYLKPLFDPMWFFPRSNISRFILFAVIPLALLAAYGVDRIATLFPRGGKAARTLLVGLIALDITSLTYQLSEQAFVLPHVVPHISPAPSPIAFTPKRYDDSGQESRTTRAFDAYKAGYGTLVYCSVLGPTPGVRTIFDEGDTGAVSALDSRAQVSIISWNYNAVSVKVDTPVPTRVVLNTNYAHGWVVNNRPVIVESNRVAADIGAGAYELRFVYHAPGLIAGIVGTVVTVLVLILLRIPRVQELLPSQIRKRTQ